MRPHLIRLRDKARFTQGVNMQPFLALKASSCVKRSIFPRLVLHLYSSLDFVFQNLAFQYLLLYIYFV